MPAGGGDGNGGWWLVGGPGKLIRATAARYRGPRNEQSIFEASWKRKKKKKKKRFHSIFSFFLFLFSFLNSRMLQGWDQKKRKKKKKGESKGDRLPLRRRWMANHRISTTRGQC